MILAGFLFLLLFTGGSTSNYSELHDDQKESNHSFEQSGNLSNFSEPPEIHPHHNQSYLESDSDEGIGCMANLLNHLTLKNEMHTMGRPVKKFKFPLTVRLSVLLHAIIDVNEKDQKFVSRIQVTMWWKTDYIRWNSSKFCDIIRLSLPTEVLWKPDIIIQEMTEKDKTSLKPFIYLFGNGSIRLQKDMVVVSSCRMQVYKFPFDVQSCNLTFKSMTHSGGEMLLEQDVSSSWATEESRRMMSTQSEWLFINIIINNKTSTAHKSIMVYTIRMRRRPALYVANFILPILFFLCLDLSSFLMSDSSGEKLGFKVTVLLAVTVMQLILNEILPASSDRIPLIAIYCIGIFGLMMCSLIETILVMYLLEKDNEAERDQSLSDDCGGKRCKVGFRNCCREVRKSTHSTCFCNVSSDELPSGLMPVGKEGNSSQLMESHDSDELTEAVRALTLLLSSRKEEGKRGYWTRVVKTINKVFIIFYVIAATVFLLYMLVSWRSGENDGEDDSDA